MELRMEPEHFALEVLVEAPMPRSAAWFVRAVVDGSVNTTLGTEQNSWVVLPLDEVGLLRPYDLQPSAQPRLQCLAPSRRLGRR